MLWCLVSQHPHNASIDPPKLETWACGTSKCHRVGTGYCQCMELRNSSCSAVIRTAYHTQQAQTQTYHSLALLIRLFPSLINPRLQWVITLDSEVLPVAILKVNNTDWALHVTKKHENVHLNTWKAAVTQHDQAAVLNCMRRMRSWIHDACKVKNANMYAWLESKCRLGVRVVPLSELVYKLKI